ncbi:4Fe-4S dicluster domain-containing protein [Cytobacillus sp. Hz8]|uniref:4Fe-4S dicluster domain-containing protein n=1 Tax=Cytobacillus sp. Hz8 TaxID=3347168 RepID=UPI0035E0E714
MSLAFKLLSSWLSRSSIHFDDSRCINNRNKYVNCTKCVDVCPSPKALVIQDQKILYDVNYCTDCKKCTYTCNSSVFIDIDLIQKLKNIKYQKSVTFSCQKIDKEKKFFPLTCLLQLKLPHILYAALKDKEIRIKYDKNLCYTCSNFNENIIDHIKNLIQDASNILEKIQYQKKITMIFNNQNLNSDEKIFSRSDFFKYIANNTTNATSEVLPDWNKKISLKEKLNRNEENILLEYCLKQLLKDVDGSGKNLMIDSSSIGIAKTKINSNCDLCGICVAHCPTGSLLIKKSDNKVFLSQQLMNCMDCFACKKTCPKEAIEFEYNVSVNDLMKDQIDLYEKQLYFCEKCGEVSQNKICDECKRKDRLENDMFQFFA